MKKLLSLIGLMIISTTLLIAATVDTVDTYSPSMKKQVRSVVILPHSYETTTAFPVLYLLHGYSGNHRDWIKNVPNLKLLADRYEMIIVCPDGNFSSWYFDSPIDSTSRYETYLSSELIRWVDKTYKTVSNRTRRAITGLSMGGHGALFVAFKHQDVFGAAGSTSGGVDLRPFPNNWDLSKRLGTYASSPEIWERHSVINLTHLLTPNSIRLIIDCGTSDFFYQVNQNLHNKLLERNIAHTYVENPGQHNWEYWSTSIQFQALYMHQYFLNSGASK
ncbi:MAG: esterase family protein [Chitinophagaceae bacterium]|nr:esterase family protein [Chitinophagaceae bacterium]